MEYKTEDQVIYPKDLLFAALYRWKVMFVAALVLGLLLGGLMLVRGFLSTDEETKAQDLAAYEKDLEDYQKEIGYLENNIQRLETLFVDQQIYMDESLYVNLDPYNHFQSVVIFYLETDYQVLPDMTYQNTDKTNILVNAYAAMLRSDAVVKALAEVLQIQPRYLRELYSVNVSEAARMITVTLLHSQESCAQALQMEVLAQLQEITDNLGESIGTHTLKLLEQSVDSRTDVSLLTLRKDNEEYLERMQRSLDEAQLALDACQPPVLVDVSVWSILKKAVVFAVLGVVAGVGCVAVWAWCAHAVTTKVYSGRLLCRRTGVKILGCMAVIEVKNPVDRKLRVWEGRNMAPVQERVEVLALDIAQRCSDVKKLLLTGAGDMEVGQPLIQALNKAMPGVVISSCGSILDSVQAVEALASADAALLVEQCDRSLYTDVADELVMIKDYGVKLLGCILLNG